MALASRAPSMPHPIPLPELRLPDPMHCLYYHYLMLILTQPVSSNLPHEHKTLRPPGLSYSPPYSAVSKQPPRPNTQIHYKLFTSHTAPMPAGSLNIHGWKKHMKEFQDEEGVAAILGSICEYGATIGYEGYRSVATIHPDLVTADTGADLVRADIAAESMKNRLNLYSDSASLPPHYTASPLGLTNKSDGSKRRIHHLSYPPGSSTSINGGIPESY